MFVQVEALFKVMWANHGDDISLQYAGTGALKSGFTRTGVRTKAGLADDGWKSGMRYYLNNFEDGHKQDAFDLVSGSYIISKGETTCDFLTVVRRGLFTSLIMITICRRARMSS